MATTLQNLKQHVYTLAGDIGERNVFRPQALAGAADYIRSVWQQQGYEVTEQRYDAKGIQCANLEVICRGSDEARSLLVIGAHYDTVRGSPGANDNATGIAALLELSRHFAHSPTQSGLRFVAFVNEESPFFYWGKMGSMVYARACKQRNDNIRFMASLETIGFYPGTPNSQVYPPLLKWFYPDRANFIAFVSNFRSRRSLRHTVKAFKHCSRFPMQHIATFSWVPGVCWSDHLAFWRYGYQAFMVTDTAFYRYPFYHTAQDTPDKIHYTPFAALTEDLFCTFARLGDAP